MPLHSGSSKKVIQKNIHEMVASGHSPKQAVAASLHNADKYADGGEAESDDSDMDDMMSQCADEMLQAIEHKDKKMLMDALEALVLHIQSEDVKQDKQDMEGQQ